MVRGRTLRFVDLFAGLGGFHVGMSQLGHECVFVSEIDPLLRELYAENHQVDDAIVKGDIRSHVNVDTTGRVSTTVPDHDVLFAGFPCQPFSKSGSQAGVLDQARGTLFYDILAIAKAREPSLIILENVGNFARHDGGRTWQIVHNTLVKLGYDVRGTMPKVAGGHGLISPHHLGYPHHRERFFVIAARWGLPRDPFPKKSTCEGSLKLMDLVTNNGDLSPQERRETRLSDQQVDCIDHWNDLIGRVPANVELPSFPIWGDEFGGLYPYMDATPLSSSTEELRRVCGVKGETVGLSRSELLEMLPAYALRGVEFPRWKRRFIKQNRDYYESIRKLVPKRWMRRLAAFPPSLRKLEWNCKGEDRDLWKCVLQFRPSGLRAKRYTSVPALVAMTVTQIPILGKKRRYITRREGLRLQGFSDEFRLPESRSAAFAALGNAVHASTAKEIVTSALGTMPGALSQVCPQTN